MKIKLFFDVHGGTRGVILKNDLLPSLSISESDNLKECISRLYSEYISKIQYSSVGRPLVYHNNGELIICYRIIVTIFPGWLKIGDIIPIEKIITEREKYDEVFFVVESFR